MATKACSPKLRAKKNCIILDTNALLVPFKFKIDIFEELRNLVGRTSELLILSPNKYELERLATEGKPRIRRDASSAMKLIEKCKCIEVACEVGRTADDVVVEVAGRMGCVVFTNDKMLRRRLRNISVPVIYVRQKSHLEIEGGL